MNGQANFQGSWLLWQLADSAFPTGGFAHSGGLEAAWQQGEARDAAELESFLEASLRQAATGALPFAGAAHDDPEQAAALDQLCDAFLSNHVANRASRLQGRAWSRAVKHIFGLTAAGPCPCGHLAPAFGATTRALGVERGAARELFLFQHLRGLMAAAVRLGIIGPMEAQATQHRLAARAREILQESEALTVDDVAQTAPLLEIWQAGQDGLYSRLFQS